MRKMTGEGLLGGELAYGGRWGGREGRGRDASTATGGRGVGRASLEAGLGTGHVKQTRKKNTGAHTSNVSGDWTRRVHLSVSVGYFCR